MILVLCQRGNVRSVTVATILKDLCMQDDVIAAGVETTSERLLSILSSLSTHVITCGIKYPSQEWIEYFAWSDDRKITELDIGADSYGRAMHPELLHKCLLELTAKTDYLNGQLRWPIEQYEQMNAAVHAKAIEVVK
jgi:hypothetical protein